MKYRIIGYTNPLYCEPAPLITLILKEERVWAVFSDGSFAPLNREEPKFDDLDSFIFEKKKKYIEQGEYSYITSSKRIITGNVFNILPFVLKDLRLTEDEELKEDLSLLIQDDLNSLGINISFDDKITNYILEYIKDVGRNRKHKKGKKSFRKAARRREKAKRASKYLSFFDKSKIDNYKDYIIKYLFEGKLAKIDNEILDLLNYQKENSSPKHIVKSLCDLSSRSLEICNFSFAKQMVFYSKLLNVSDIVIDTQYAEILKAEGNLADAKQIYLEVQEKYPDNIVAKTGYAEILKAEGNLTGAKQIYLEVQEKDPSDIVAKTGYAEILKAEGNLSDAKQIYLEVQEKYPFDKFSLHGILTIYLMQNNLDEYLKFSNIPKNTITEDDYYFEHSHIIYLIKLGDYKNSRKLLEKGVSLCVFPKTLILYKRTLTYLNLLEKKFNSLLTEIKELEYTDYSSIDYVFSTHLFAEINQLKNASEKLEIVDRSELPLIIKCSELLKKTFFSDDYSKETQIVKLYEAELNALLVA